MTDESPIDPDDLRSDIRGALTGIGLSLLLFGWTVWMIHDFGMTIYFAAAGAFAAITLLIFGYQAVSPALQLRRENHTLFDSG